MSDQISSCTNDPSKTGFAELTIEKFREYLQSRGYANATIEQYVGAAKQFHSWL